MSAFVILVGWTFAPSGLADTLPPLASCVEVKQFEKLENLVSPITCADIESILIEDECVRHPIEGPDYAYGHRSCYTYEEIDFDWSKTVEMGDADIVFAMDTVRAAELSRKFGRKMDISEMHMRCPLPCNK